MKTYHQFSEDIEQRRIELRQRSLDQQKRFKKKSRSSTDAQRQRTSETKMTNPKPKDQNKIQLPCPIYNRKENTLTILI